MGRMGILACVMICSGAAAAEAAASVPPVYTNKTQFRIPYHYDAVEMQRLGAREIRLYVSVDRGVTWQRVQNVAPQARRFDFEAPADGEYWFAVRTLDARNQLHPPSNVMEPGLVVVVDTTAPTLDVRLRQAAPGRVELAWEADDPHLDAETLRLEFIQTDAAEWQAVSVQPRAAGRTTWSVPRGGFVAVRGTIRDRASNSARAQSQTRIEPAAGEAEGPIPDFREPIALGPRDEVPWGASNEGLPTYPNGSDASPAAPPTPAPLIQVTPSSRPRIGASPAAPAMPAPGRFVSDTPASRPEILKAPPVDLPAPASRRPPDGTRIVNSRRFQIDYKIDDVGPSGVSSVDLFITEDEGAEWFKYGSDPDRQSPFAVEVPAEGLYGFALRVRSGAGLAAAPPSPGEKPEFFVLVDETPPVVQLLPVRQGEGAAANEITIRWQISDTFPADKPVAISYAADRGGPWEPIVGWQEDTGSHTWQVGAGVPKKFYLRLTVRDAAGNVTRIETPEPLIVDLSRPTARIVNIESAAGMQ